MVVFNKSLQTNSNQTILKKRFEKKPRHPTLHFGDIGLFLTRQIRFEYGYMLYIRRFIKRIIKKRRKKIFKIRHRRKRVWFCIRPNYILSKKSKNSRMGKGKGGFKR
jgi:ribosomal protein L16/L10AE